MPLNSNGKIDKSQLPNVQQHYTRDEFNRASSPNSDPFAYTLSKIWCEILQISSILPEDNFFDLGGDSLRAAMIVKKAHQQNIPLNILDIVTYPTITDLVTNVLLRSELDISIQKKYSL